MLATSMPLGGPNNLAGIVLRSPDGGYLFGLAERYVSGQGEDSGATLHAAAVSARTFNSPDAFMAVVAVDGEQEVTPRHAGRHLLVIAPAGADRVTARGITAKVENRLAIIDLPELPDAYTDGETPLPAELSEVKALDEAGVTLQTVTMLTTDLDGSGRVLGEGAPPGRADVSSQIR